MSNSILPNIAVFGLSYYYTKSPETAAIITGGGIVACYIAKQYTMGGLYFKNPPIINGYKPDMKPDISKPFVDKKFK